jgi:hypothetical protein
MVAFTVRPEDAEQAAGVNPGRLLLVLGAALLYLSGGTALAVYCFSHNFPKHDADWVQGPEPDSGAISVDPAPLVRRPTLRVDAAQQRKIDNAIARGAWYLKDHILPQGTWGENFSNLPGLSVGFASLPGLTLLECGIPANDPVVRRAAELVRKEASHLGGAVRATYQLSLAILFLDRLGEYKDKPLIQYLALCLIAGQRSDGGWTYDCPALDNKMVEQLLRLLGDPKHSIADWHNAAIKEGAFTAGGWDNSNTQFAILALWIAQRHQVPIDKPINLAEKHFRTTQLHRQGGSARADPTGNNADLDGSWQYNAGSNSSAWPSMTCAGLVGLAIGHGIRNDSKEKNHNPLDDPAIKAGLAMLAREIDRPGEKRSPDHYFLWSVQRVGVLYGLDLIGGKDWYAWGCKSLLPRQKNDGSWIDGSYYDNNPVLNTCFALLFLKRANLAKDLTIKLQPLEN